MIEDNLLPYTTSFLIDDNNVPTTMLSRRKDGSYGGIYVTCIENGIATASFRDEIAARNFIKKYNKKIRRFQAIRRKNDRN